MASRKRYTAYIRSIKTLPDFGWTEHYTVGRSFRSTYSLNGCMATPSYSCPTFYTVTKSNGEVREFSTTGKSFAQVHQEMTDYALGKED